MKNNKGELQKIVFIIGLLLFLFVCYIICKQNISTSDKIQAGAIIGLVFITLFYAWQTQQLVQYQKVLLLDEQKKRMADFWLKRLNEYYLPFRLNLLKVQATLKFKPLPIEELSEVLLTYVEKISTNEYMVSKDVSNSTSEWLKNVIEIQAALGIEDIKESKIGEICSSAQKVLNLLDEEVRFVQDLLVDMYGFFTIEDQEGLCLTEKKGAIRKINHIR